MKRTAAIIVTLSFLLALCIIPLAAEGKSISGSQINFHKGNYVNYLSFQIRDNPDPDGLYLKMKEWLENEKGVLVEVY